MSMGGLQKYHERGERRLFDSNDYVLVRIDGRSFHSYCRGLRKPFDEDLMTAMNQTTKALAKEVAGFRLGYVQSDEISLLITARPGPPAPNKSSELWMGGNLAKLVSLTASIATAKFNQIRCQQGFDKLAHFDSRVWAFRGNEAGRQLTADYFKWRRDDAIKNSISMAASVRFSPRELHGVNRDDRMEMLKEAGHPWDELPERFRFGRAVVKKTVAQEVSYFDKRLGEVSHITADRTKVKGFTPKERNQMSEYIPRIWAEND